MPKVLAAEWQGGADGFLRLLDQTLLPTELAFRACRDVETVFEAIRALRVRGAPAIGIAAAYGVCLGAQADDWFAGAQAAADRLRVSRPTAVNLFWALDRMLARRNALEPASAAAGRTALLAEAHAVFTEDVAMCAAIGRHGAALLPDRGGVITHCNAGALATGDHGTALAAIFQAHADGKRIHVFADETRPLLQGARLTAWELTQRGVPCTLICDNMAGLAMKTGKIQASIVGADRIAANGDAANKIGTYSLAVLAARHGIPFYVAAPSSTFDLALAHGDLIPIEERDPREITHGFGRQTAPEGVQVWNPAFDVTPAELIAGIVTERGVLRAPYGESIARVVGGADRMPA